MRITTPHPGMLSRPGSTLKPAMRPGGLNTELRQNEALLRYAPGGILPARNEPFSAVTSAIMENEQITRAALAKERANERKATAQQRTFAQRYHSRNEQLEAELKQQQEAFKSGSVAYALWQLDKQYAPQMPEKAPAPMPARIANSSKVITRSGAAPSQRQYITREAPGGSYTRTIHTCGLCGRDARYMQAENNGLMRLWYCEAHKPWTGKL